MRATIAQILINQGVRTNPDHVLVTSGSQQGIALVCQSILKPGDTVLVEQPTYNLALELFSSLELQPVGVPLDADGLMVDQIEQVITEYHPGLIYTIPNFQNPSGTCLEQSRRRQLLTLAVEHNIPILEDDYVGDLRYDGRNLPAIKSADPNGSVIYTGTFSKMLMPGLRMGYLVADGPVFDQLVRMKRAFDLTTSTIMQRTLNDFVSVGRYQIHLRRSYRVYRKRRDAMLAAIRRYLPEDVICQNPRGGLFFWLHLPEGLSSTRLLEAALTEGVEFAPGTRFFIHPQDGEGYIRLNLAVQPPDRIEEGMKRLGAAMSKEITNRAG